MSNDDFNRAVQAEVARQVLGAKIQRIHEAGQKAYPDWDSRAAAVVAQGDVDQIVSAIDDASTATDHKPERTARLLHELGSDPEKAARVVGLDKRQRIAELTRMDIAASRPKAPTVPQPPPRQKHWLEGNDEKKVTEDFFATMKRRAERR
jgi:cob(I)alamin adenosyltransferase